MNLKKRNLRKAQMFSGEFMLAYFVFLIALGMLLYIWTGVTTSINDSEEFFTLEEVAVDVSEQLIRTAGVPIGWNSTNIYAVGLSDANRSRILSNQAYEFAKLMNTSDGSYENNTYLLGLGAYDFYFKIARIPPLVLNGRVVSGGNLTNVRIAYFSHQPNELDFTSYLQNTSFVWDFYWGLPNLPAGANYSTARYAYNGTKANVTEWLINNLSGYDSVVLDNSGINISDINSSQQDALKNYILDGGLIVQKGDGNIITLFNMSFTTSYVGAVGEVADEDYIINGEIGNVSGFEEGHFVYSGPGDNELTVAIEIQGFPNQALIGRWEYGRGSVRYIADSDGCIGDLCAPADKGAFPTINLPIMLAFNEYVIEVGKEPLANATHVITTKRSAVLDEDIVQTTLTVWS